VTSSIEHDLRRGIKGGAPSPRSATAQKVGWRAKWRETIKVRFSFLFEFRLFFRVRLLRIRKGKGKAIASPSKWRETIKVRSSVFQAVLFEFRPFLRVTSLRIREGKGKSCCFALNATAQLKGLRVKL
jgi:hypothetical protein